MDNIAGVRKGATELELEWQRTFAALNIPADASFKVKSGLQEIRSHHLPTYEHCMRVGLLSDKIGQVEGHPRKPLFYAGSLHDRGKQYVSPILLSKTTEWTQQDAEALRDHPATGHDKTLSEGMAVTAGILVLHHTFQPNAYPENIPENGPCLPQRLKQKIRILGRLVALADFYDAAHRPDQSDVLTGDQVKEKVFAHNPDLSPLIQRLYDAGVFSTDYRELLST